MFIWWGFYSSIIFCGTLAITWLFHYTIVIPQTIIVSEDDEDPSGFRAAVVSVGMFGVLSEITLHVDRAFNLKERRTPQTLDFCLENLDSLVNGHQYVKFWVEFYNNFCVVYETDKTDEAIGGNPGMIESFLTVIA